MSPVNAALHRYEKIRSIAPLLETGNWQLLCSTSIRSSAITIHDLFCPIFSHLQTVSIVFWHRWLLVYGILTLYCIQNLEQNQSKQDHRKDLAKPPTRFVSCQIGIR